MQFTYHPVHHCSQFFPVFFVSSVSVSFPQSFSPTHRSFLEWLFHWRSFSDFFHSLSQFTFRYLSHKIEHTSGTPLCTDLMNSLSFFYCINLTSLTLNNLHSSLTSPLDRVRVAEKRVSSTCHLYVNLLVNYTFLSFFLPPLWWTKPTLLKGQDLYHRLK